MAVSYRTQGFVFKKQNRAEADKVFSIFTSEFGRLEIFAKAIRKITSKLRGGIEIFSLSEIEFIQGKNHKTLTDTIAKDRFNNILKDPYRLKISYRIGDLLDNFIKGQEKEEEIFSLLKETLERIDDVNLSKINIQLAYYYFFWNFISILGYQPEIQRCAMSGSKLNPDDLYFSNKEGGVVCGDCSSDNPKDKKVNSDVVKILRLILNKDWNIISKLKIEDPSQRILEKTSDEYYLYLLSNHSNNSKQKYILYN